MKYMKHIKKINEFHDTEETGHEIELTNRSSDWMNDEEQIETMWHLKFDDKDPTPTEKMEWYHEMRTKGFDGILIFDVVGHLM